MPTSPAVDSRSTSPGGELLADAAAGFYWGTMLPSVIERTTAPTTPTPLGYVRSTMAGMYAGTYPTSTTSSRSRAASRGAAASTSTSCGA